MRQKQFCLVLLPPPLPPHPPIIACECGPPSERRNHEHTFYMCHMCVQLERVVLHPPLPLWSHGMWCVSASLDRRRAMFARPLLVVLRVASTASARAAATNQSNWPSAGCARLPSPLKFYAWEGSAMLGRIRAGSPPPLLSGAVCGAQGHHHSTQLDRGHSIGHSLDRSGSLDRSFTLRATQAGGMAKAQVRMTPLVHTRTASLRSWVGAVDGRWERPRHRWG